MSEDIYRDAYKTAVEVGQKFDYWVAGIISAVLAYSVQHYEPRKYDSLQSIIEPIALFLLFVSFVFSFKKLRVSFFQANGSLELVDHQRQVDNLTKAIHDFPQGANDTNTGFRSAEQMQAEIKERREQIAVKQKELAMLEKESRWAFNFRQWFFVLGFALLLVAKVFAPLPQSRSVTAPAAMLK